MELEIFIEVLQNRPQAEFRSSTYLLPLQNNHKTILRGWSGVWGEHPSETSGSGQGTPPEKVLNRLY